MWYLTFDLVFFGRPPKKASLDAPGARPIDAHPDVTRQFRLLGAWARRVRLPDHARRPCGPVFAPFSGPVLFFPSFFFD